MGWTAPTSAFYFTSGSGVAGASGNEVPPELPDFIDSATGGAGSGVAAALGTDFDDPARPHHHRDVNRTNKPRKHWAAVQALVDKKVDEDIA